MKNRWNKYIESDYEKLHTKRLDGNLEENEIDKIIDVRTGCSYVTKTVDAGLIREVETYPIYLKKDMPDEWKRRESKEARKNLNNKNAQKSFIRKINTNFVDGDYHITLPYDAEHIPSSHKEAKRDMQNYIRRLKRRIKKENIQEELKYIYVTEHSETKKGIRCHHHLIINAILPRDIIEELWTHGKRIKSTKLHGDELHLTGLAMYLSKDPKGKKRWCCSKNLKKPKITRSHSKFTKKRINNMTRNQNLVKEEMEKSNPGYVYIDHQIYINEYNGKPYIYARMRKLD